MARDVLYVEPQKHWGQLCPLVAAPTHLFGVFGAAEIVALAGAPGGASRIGV
jgi:hypothetical protein